VENAKSGDNIESVSKNNQNSKMEEDGKADVDKKMEQDDHPVNNIINEMVEDVIKKEALKSDDKEDSDATTEGWY